MEIKVNDYVRTEFGNIGKFYRPASESSDVYYIYINKDGNKISSRYDSIVKHSKNIIDLIECGDYVNGHKVVNEIYGEDDNELYFEIEGGFNKAKYIGEKDIKSVLTNEQFSSLEYII